MRRLITALLVLGSLALAAPAAAEQNGQLPRSSLAEIQIPGSNVAFLHAGSVAASWNTMNWCATRDGTPLYPGPSHYTPAATAYRDYATQVIFKQIYGSNAATPGFSNHGWGHAVDLGNVATMRPWTDSHGGAFGWEKRTSDASWEPWHLSAAWRASTWTAPDPGTSFEFPVLRPGSGGICISGPVQEAQRRLRIAQTGHYGASLGRHVLAFKAAHGLRHDTTIGERTWRVLRR